jgi:hypothetical protein
MRFQSLTASLSTFAATATAITQSCDPASTVAVANNCAGAQQMAVIWWTPANPPPQDVIDLAVHAVQDAGGEITSNYSMPGFT